MDEKSISILTMLFWLLLGLVGNYFVSDKYYYWGDASVFKPWLKYISFLIFVSAGFFMRWGFSALK